jgi:glycosyltransferase involved in cell wall biosynthesis
VVEFNGSEVWIARNWGHGLAHEPLFEEVERRGLQAADLIVAVSEPLRDQLREAGVPDDRILINPNGVDAERFDPGRLSGRREEIRRELALEPGELLAGFVGTFGPWHGAETLAEAICRLDEPWSRRMRFLFIGDGDRRAATEKIVRDGGRADRVTFTGLLPQHETPAYLSACDLCVSPHVPNTDGTAFFGSPTKLFEYLATARPVLASDLGQIGEVLEHERNALLVPPGDVGALVDGLVRLAEDPALRQRLGDEGVKDARTRFSWTAHVQRILDRLEAPGAGARS